MRTLTLAFGLLMAMSGVCHASPYRSLGSTLVDVVLTFLLVVFSEAIVCYWVIQKSVPKLLLSLAVGNSLSGLLVLAFVPVVVQNVGPSGTSFQTLAVGMGASLVLSFAMEVFVVCSFFSEVSSVTVRRGVVRANLLTHGAACFLMLLPM